MIDKKLQCMSAEDISFEKSRQKSMKSNLLFLSKDYFDLTCIDGTEFLIITWAFCEVLQNGTITVG